MSPHDPSYLGIRPPTPTSRPTPHPGADPLPPSTTPTPTAPSPRPHGRRNPGNAVRLTLAALLFTSFAFDVTVRTPRAHALAGGSDIGRELAEVEASLAEARGDAASLRRLLTQADRTLAAADQDLALAQRRWADARRRSLEAAEELGRAQSEVWRMEEVRNEQARRTYMTKGPTIQLTALLGAESFQQVERSLVMLSRAARASNESLVQLRAAQHRAAAAKARIDTTERAARAEQAAVAAKVAQLRRVRLARAQAKAALDQKVAGLAARRDHLAAAVARAGAPVAVSSTGAPRRAEAAEPEVQVARSAGGACDLSGVSADERFLIMRESGGRSTAANPSSSAFGLGQLLHGNRVRYLGRDHSTTDCGKQLQAFRGYVRDAYGSASAARGFWEANGWY